jgi:hypothetical protein
MLSFPLADRAAPGATRTWCGELSPSGFISCFQVGQTAVDALLRSDVYVVIVLAIIGDAVVTA